MCKVSLCIEVQAIAFLVRSFAVAGPQIWNSLPADLLLVEKMLALGDS